MAVSISPPEAAEKKLEALELDLLLEGIYQFLAADFRSHDRAAVARRVFDFMRTKELKTVSALQERVLHHPGTARALLRSLSRHAHALFDDPVGAAHLRELAGALLRSYAAPAVWLAECTSPEEVFSLAILLEEEGVLHRTRIYATGSNAELLLDAKERRFDIGRVDEYEQNYLSSGGKRSFAEYWETDNGQARFRAELDKNIIWAEHDMSADASFNEFQMILCRKPLSWYGERLRRRVLALFGDSLSQYGILQVDDGELEAPVAPSACFNPLSVKHGIYRHTG